MGVGSLERDWIVYPDDPTNGYSLIRAWDRHLKRIGLLPIGTSDSSKVGPILVDPYGSHEYIEFYFDARGHLDFRREVLL